MAEAAERSPSASVDEALAGMDEEAALAYIAAKAKEMGIGGTKVSVKTVDNIMADFAKLDEADKIKVAGQAAEAVGGYLGFEADTAESDMPAIPDFLKR